MNESKHRPSARPDAPRNAVKQLCLRADAGRQAALDTLHERCHTTTLSGAMWRALEGYVPALDALESARRRIERLERALDRIVGADIDLAKAEAARRERMAEAGEVLGA